jgi:fluoride ion exporter CrcB/FEX
MEFLQHHFVMGTLIVGIIGAFLLRFAMKNPDQAGGLAKIIMGLFRRK